MARSGGRRAKQQQRQQGLLVAPAFITRKIPTYDLLSEESLVAIENNAEILGEEIGVDFKEDEEVLQLSLIHI